MVITTILFKGSNLQFTRIILTSILYEKSYIHWEFKFIWESSKFKFRSLGSKITNRIKKKSNTFKLWLEEHKKWNKWFLFSKLVAWTHPWRANPKCRKHLPLPCESNPPWRVNPKILAIDRKAHILGEGVVWDLSATITNHNQPALFQCDLYLLLFCFYLLMPKDGLKVLDVLHVSKTVKSMFSLFFRNSLDWEFGGRVFQKKLYLW